MNSNKIVFCSVKHLILADPWGIPEKPDDYQTRNNIPLWVKAIAYAVRPLNPLWAVRAAGPFGQWVVEKTRPDITRKFAAVVQEENIISQYIHQCNAQTPRFESLNLLFKLLNSPATMF